MKVKDSNGNWQTLKVKNYGIEQTPIGSMVYYPSQNIPNGYLLCDGSEYLIADYPLLFNAIGYIGGTDVDTGYFRVPNMEGVVPGGYHPDLSSGHPLHGEFGDQVGNPEVYLSLQNMPNEIWHSNTGLQSGGVKSSVNYGADLGVATQATNFDQPVSIVQPTKLYSWIIKAKNVVTLGGYTEDFEVAGDLTLHNGATSYGDLLIEESSGAVGYYAKRADTGTEVWMGVGSGGANHGVYSKPLNAWLVYSDKTKGYLYGGINFDSSGNIATNGYITSANGIYWKEGGYGDKFKIIPYFSGVDDNNLLKIQGAVGEAGTDPTLYDLVTISGKSGNVKVKGSLTIGNLTRDTTNTWVPVIQDGKMNYTLRKIVNTQSHTDYPNNQDYLATMSFLSYWNGAYNANTTSNLTYCYQGTIQAKPTTLYNNSSGTQGTVTLSSSAADFSYLEVFYGPSGGNVNESRRVFSPNGKIVRLTYYSSKSWYYKTLTMSGTSVTINNYGRCHFDDAGTCVENEDGIYLYKIIGYK